MEMDSGFAYTIQHKLTKSISWKCSQKSSKKSPDFFSLDFFTLKNGEAIILNILILYTSYMSKYILIIIVSYLRMKCIDKNVGSVLKGITYFLFLRRNITYFVFLRAYLTLDYFCRLAYDRCRVYSILGMPKHFLHKHKTLYKKVWTKIAAGNSIRVINENTTQYVNHFVSSSFPLDSTALIDAYAGYKKPIKLLNNNVPYPIINLLTPVCASAQLKNLHQGLDSSINIKQNHRTKRNYFETRRLVYYR
ncbi:FLYWCH-type domain-containing protein [Aphis craccivora]|uniref:FLYWCH-type domain-containing protein n=1 Tax=Aphis craccivora TaxID=307492 RepID=A0A6G0YBI3_APHCR|nr:FLYWCH-type domain-containing protein [Aphis craccivora]